MGEGIRTTVEFASPSVCTLATVSAETGETIDTTATSVVPPGDRGTVTDFRLDADQAIERADLTHVISYERSDVYRLRHGNESGCPCARLGQHGCPVERFVASHGDLRIVFHATDYDQLETVVADLREEFSGLEVVRLVRSPADRPAPRQVFVDRSRLTDRQLQVLETAYRMGYFEHPKRANATEVAAEIGITRSTFAEHLAAAQGKVLGDVLEDDP